MIIASDYDNTFNFLSPDDKDSVDFIITGNNYTEYSRLYDDGVRIPVFWNPDKEELMNIVNHKANIINKTGASTYFEDQDTQIMLLKTLCPKCKIIKVSGGNR